MLTINNTLDGYLKDVEILGSTIQSASNLADIRSVGDKIEGQELYEIPVVSCGKNLLNPSIHTTLTKVGDEYSVNTITNNYVSYKLKPSTDYILSFKKSSNPCWVAVDVIGYSSFNNGGWDFKQVYRTNSDGILSISIRANSNENVGNIIKNIQLEEGTVATPYEPYQEDKLTILSPTPLEKVGDVADRIICKDGVWGVEKNVVTEFVLGNSWIQLTFDDVIMFGTSSNYSMSKGFGISNYFIYEASDNNTEHFKYDIKNSIIYTYIKKSKLSTEDGVGFLKWSKENGYYHKFATTNPQFIPLPHDQQVKLRTFANKTNISFLTEIEGTIKAQVPKSLGATVNTHTEQINSLNKELDRVKKLEESTVSTVTTESDFTTVEATSNGYFEDVKLEGKTLVNLLQGAREYTLTRESVESNSTQAMCETYVLDKNKDYTAIYIQISREGDLPKFNIYNAETGKADYYKPNLFDTNTTGYEVVIKKINRSCNWQNMRIYYDNERIGTTKFKLLLLEGDHTQNPPSYFEGLKSVGQSATTSEDGADEIVVSSVKGDGNLFGFESTKFNCSSTGWYDVQGVPNMYSDMSKKTQCQVYLPAGTYTVGYDGVNSINVGTFQLVSIDDNVVVNANSSDNFKNTKFLNEGVYTVRIRSASSGEVFVKDVQILKGDTLKPYTLHQSDKKRLLYYNEETQTWEKPILREWDSIEKHADGKYYYHQRSAEVVLNGSEGWNSLTLSASGLEAYAGFGTPIENGKVTLIGSNYVIDTHGFANQELDTINNNGYLSEALAIHVNGNLYIRILKSKLPTQDVAGFKQWLQANPVTVVYQLAEEKVYECTNIDLITYANETNYVVESGAIAPKTTLKVHNNISNVVKILQEKVSLLENKFIQGLKKVLAGDMYSLAELLYPEDFVEENPENNIMLLPFE